MQIMSYTHESVVHILSRYDAGIPPPFPPSDVILHKFAQSLQYSFFLSLHLHIYIKYVCCVETKLHKQNVIIYETSSERKFTVMLEYRRQSTFVPEKNGYVFSS